MTYNNKLLTINELQEAKYFSDEQKEFLKDYQFSYILQGYQDISMQTDDDCGHSITKIAVVENKECGDIKDIGTIDIATETSCPVTNWTELLGGDMYVSRYISSNNISGFPSHCNENTENMFNDNRKEVFDKLDILDDARKWYDKKCSTENLSQDDGITKYLEDRFSKHIFCDKCHSIINSSHWKNYGLWRTHEMQGVGEDAVEVEREYFDMQCPICGEHKEVDANEHLELNKFEDKVESPDIDLQDPFGTVEVPDIDSQNPFETFKSIGPKPCSICGKMFCEHRYPF